MEDSPLKSLRRALRHPMFTVGLLILLSVIIVAAFADIIAPKTYREMDLDNAFAPPSRAYPFGTDNYGRCVFSRVVYGSRIALRVGLIVVSIQAILGISMGLVAGYYGGTIDKVISFTCDVTWSMPPLVFAMAIIMALGPSLNNVIISIAVVSWAEMARVVRSKTQSTKAKAYVEAARALGRTDAGIMWRHILPNIMSPIIVLVTLALPLAILSTTSLSFLGLGAQPPTPDWGVILNEGIDFIQQAPWFSIFPGVALVYTVLGFNLIGIGLRDILDPQIRDI